MPTVVTDRLREALKGEPRPLIICGAGVSVSASDGAAPSWTELIEAGIDRAEGIDSSLHAWAEYARYRLRHEGAASWIEVADELTARLGGQHNAEFLEFLEEKVGRLELRDTRLIEALVKLGCPLATTNYDDLLSRASGRPVVNWTEAEEVARCLSGQWQGIIHLHGHWRKPETVVLGTRSYNHLVSDERSRLIGQMAALTRPAVFVGCSLDGISDPDFAELDRFIGQWQAASQPRYLLVKAGGNPAPQLERRLYPVVYGDSHDELAPFLEQQAACLAPGPAAKVGSAEGPIAAVHCIDKKVPKPELFGRDGALADIAAAAAEGRSAIIAGGPGIGKTALAVATLYDESVKLRYKENRVLVSLDEATEPHALLARLADELGLSAAGDEVSLLRSLEVFASSQPVIAILDNAELVFEDQRTEAERVLRLAAQVPRLTVIVTIRGAAPYLPGAFVIDDLTKLSPEAAREAFLATAGHNFAGDPDLPGLLSDLDGHALSIQLISAQAAGTPRLKPLLDAWEEEHAAMVVSGDHDHETRSSSLRASLALSVNSPRIRNVPLSRKLLSILAYLPAGLGEADVAKLLGSPGQVNRTKAGEAVAVLHKLRLVERRLDARLRMLNPLREGVRLLTPIAPPERRRLVDKFLKIARQSDHVGTDNWPGVRHIVEAERGNLDYVCLIAARNNITDSRVQDALWGYGNYVRLTGGSDIASIEYGAEEACRRGLRDCAASLLFELGSIHSQRFDFKAGAVYFSRGMNLAPASSVVMRGQCVFGLAEISFANSDHGEAERCLEQGISLSKGYTLLEANFKSLLLQIRLRQGNLDEAAPLVDEIRQLYPEESLGMANALGYLAKLHPEEAPELLTRAITLCERLGVPVSQANRLNQLGAFTMKQHDYASAINYFSEALTLGRSAGGTTVEAEALLRRGRARECLGDAAGHEEVAEGINLYLRITSSADRARSGWLALQDALFCDDEPRIVSLRQSAADAWVQVERRDLVADFANGLFPESIPVS